MKNKIRFAITVLAIILFAACFFVACSDDVVSGKNNDHSYAEVLESNGAFAYMDKNYETFQDVIDAIAKTGAEGTISVLGNVKSRSVTIPENAQIFIDLGGHEIEFFDVESSAITIGVKASLAAFNGSFSMADKKEDLSVINAVGNDSAVVLYENLTIKAAGQTALFLDAGSSTILDKDVVIEGATIARGGKENTSLTTFCDLPDVRMRGAQLVVGGSAVAVVTVNSGENEYIVSPTATIVDKTGGTIGPIEKGVCYIIRAGETFTFGSLREAIETLSDKGETIVLITEEKATSEEPIALSKSVTIDLNGYPVVGTNNIVLDDGVVLTIFGVAENAVKTAIPSFTGTITSDAAGSSSLILNLVEMNSDINVSRTVSANNSVFHGNISAGSGVYLTESEVKGVGENTVDITSAFGDIVLADVTGVIGDLTASSLGGDVIINNAEATGSLITGNIKAVSHVTLTGSSVPTNVAASLTIGGTVELSGKLTSSKVLFTAAVSAGSVEDVGSVFCDDIAAKGDLSFIDSYFYEVKAIESTAGGNIEIKKSYGSVDRVETKAPEADAKATASGSITIDTSDNEQYSLTVGDVWATYYVAESEIYYGDITLKGNAETGYLTVIGSVIGKDIKAENVTFDSDNQQDRSIFGYSVDLKTSRFVSGWGTEVPASNFYSIEAIEDIDFTTVEGTTGALTAKNVTVKNSEAFGKLTTGAIEATVASITGKIVDEVNYVVIDGTVTLSGKLTSADSAFIDVVKAASVEDNGSDFYADITATTGDVMLTGSKLYSASEPYPAVTSEAGSILMTGVSGTTGALTASGTGNDVTINNKDSGLITTGSITADDAVSLTGRTGNVVTAGAVHAVSLNASYAAVTGIVSLSGDLTSANSVFESVITAATVVDAGSTFKSAISTKANGGGAKFTGSVFASTEEQPVAVLSLSGNIEMTGVTGISGNLRSALGSVTIDNAQNTAAFETGAIKAAEAVSITGNSSANVVVGYVVEGEDAGLSVKASILDIVYATVNGYVELIGNMSSAKSIFNGSIEADVVVDKDSIFNGDIITNGNVTLTGSTFGSTTTSYPAVTSEAGSILMTGVSGTTGALTASGTGNDVTINNKDSGLITTGSITADDAVSLTGRTGNVVTAGAVHAVSLNASYAAVTGIVSLSGDLTSANSVFESVITAATVVDAGSTFKSAISTKANGGGAKFTGSVFASTEEQPVAVLSLSGNIEMTGVTGISGNLRSALGSVTIDNAQNTAAFETGAIKAAEAVSITGNSSANVVVGYVVEGEDAGLSVKASILDIVYATVNGYVKLSGDMSSAYSVFNSTISANAIIDNASTFSGTFTITAEEGIVFANTVFENSPAITSKNSDIEMTKATGLVGALTAAGDVTIDNAKAGATLTTGSIEAGNAVSVTGALLRKVTVAGTVKSISLNSAYAIVGDTVVLSGDLTSSNSTFNGAIRATTVTDTRSTFNNDILARNDVALTGSAFGSDTADVSSVSGSIVMTRVTGTVKTLNSFRSSVTIDNSQSYGTLSTGAITAAEAVTLTGRNTAESLTVAGVTATTLDVTYVTVNGTVKLSDNLTSEKSVFTVNADVTAYAVVATNSTIKGDITAEGDITLENAVLHNTSDIASTNGDIKLTKATGESGTITASTYGKNVTIDNAKAIGWFITAKITAGNAVTVTGNSDHHVAVYGVSGSTLDAVFTNFHSEPISTKNGVTINESFVNEASIKSTFGSIEMTNVTGNAGDLEAYSVTIDNSEAKETLTTGAISTTYGIKVTGNHYHKVTVGSVSKGSTLDVVHAILTGSVSVTGNLVSTDSEFKRSVTAATITDTRGTFNGSDTSDVITAVIGDVKLTDSKISVTAATSENGVILMTNVTNAVADTASGKLTASSVTINNSQSATKLKTGVIEATDSVTVKGRNASTVSYVDVAGVSGVALDVTYATISGDVMLSGNLKSAYSVFSSTTAVPAYAVSAYAVVDEGSTFKGSVTATTGDITLTGSIFEAGAYSVKSEKGSIGMTKVTGSAGDLTAYSVTINNADATYGLTTGKISAADAVSVIGNSAHHVTVAGVNGTTLNMAYAELSETGANTVNISGKLTSSDAIFFRTVTAALVADERSIFHGSIDAKGDVTLAGSEFVEGTTSQPGVGSLASIEMTKVSGHVGAVNATSVTIDNNQAKVNLTVDGITAVDAVSVIGSSNTSYSTTVGAVSGSTLDVTNAEVTGEVTLKGNLTSVNTTFNASVSANSVVDEGSTFVGAIIANTGDVTLVGSTINSSSADVASTKGNIGMTKVTGTAGALTAYSIDIDNAQATDTLTTGVITADGAVSVTGNAGKKVTVGGVANASTLDTVYATVTGAVTITGDLTSANSAFSGAVTLKGDQTSLTATDSTFTGSVELTGNLSDLTSENSTFDDTAITGNLTATDSVFTGSVSAATVTDTRGTFNGANTDAITATTGDVTLTGSTFGSGKVKVNATYGSITMTKVSGTAGALNAYKVNINNAQSTVVFETGAITAVDAVTVTGNANRQVTVDGSITGTTLDANYANLMGSINTKTYVKASNCTVGNGTTDDDVTSASVTITGSRIMLDSLAADSVTITSPVMYGGDSSSVSSIVAKNLSVTAENDKFSVGTVSAGRMISIAGGTFTGAFTFYGSADSTISAGKFEGAFSHTGSATLAITGGFFTGSQTLSSGVTTINGTYDTTPGRVGWNLTFKDLHISNNCLCYIQSGYFEAADATQLSNLGENVSQSSGTSTKFVDIVYTKSTIGSGNPTNLRMADAEKVKKVIVTFGNDVDVTSHLHFFYPTNVELKGSILLDSDDYNVYSYYRKLDDSSDRSVVWRYDGSYSRIPGAWDGYNERWQYVF